MQEYITVDLPGKSKYKEDFTIKVRKITPIEQRYVLSMKNKQQKSNVDYVNFLKQIIVLEGDIEFEDLFWYDVQYLLYKIRFTTYSNYPLEFGFKCNHGNEENELESFTHVLDIGSLDIYTPEDIEDFEDTILLDNLGEVQIRNKTQRDDIEIEKFIRKNKLEENDLNTTLLLVDLLTISEGKTLNEMYALAENGTVTLEDMVKIEQWLAKHIWGVKESFITTCPVCGKETSKNYVLFLEDFFCVNRSR